MEAVATTPPAGASARVSCPLYPGRRLGNPRSAPYTLRDDLLSARLRGRTRGRMEHGATADGLPALNRQTLQKARERAHLQRSSRLYQSKGLPPVAVHVLWHPHQALRSRRIPELAADLANLVLEHLPEPGHEAAIRRPHPAWRSLPHEVASLWVDRRKHFSKNLWTSVHGASVPTLTH